jgi:hypothetical protein
MRRYGCVALGTTVLWLSLAGCGGVSDAPETGDVSGYVKLDGQPVSGATVIFQPTEGRPSNGRTDDEGYYELTYSRSQSGAKLGSHQVRITTFIEADDEGTPGVEEKIPVKYNAKTELTKEVEAGDNEINFDLTSK